MPEIFFILPAAALSVASVGLLTQYVRAKRRPRPSTDADVRAAIEQIEQGERP
ncbi:hypothetical protein VB773_01030 [Haloarculaceae archaeon H-GB2-1]|nr:hypothetical protein [Haloarculaceae archaeon H-GB1-1]MEA5406303.1 hypothetical protein [Haloarculaceae archaeon H-GB2-1]